MTYQMRIRAVLCWSAGTDSEAGLAKRRRTSLLPDTSARSALSSRSSDYREDCGLTPVGAETLRTSCGLLIFVEEAAEAVVSLDLVDLGRRAVGECPCGGCLAQAAVRAMMIVVALELA
jgi:hypothetical protein